MGTTNYCKSILHRFAHIINPFVHLPKKGLHFEWSPAQQVAFDTLEQRLKSAPIL